MITKVHVRSGSTTYGSPISSDWGTRVFESKEELEQFKHEWRGHAPSIEILGQWDNNDVEGLSELYRHLCQVHDTSYQYSDDHSVWSKGNAESKRLNSIAKLLPEGEAKRIWNEVVLKSYGETDNPFLIK